MEQQGDLGQATEMAAYDRMNGGNAAAKAAVNARKKQSGGAGKNGKGE